MSNVTFYLFINLFHLFSYHYAFNIMKTSKVVPNYTLPFRNRFIPCMVKIFFNPLKREYGLFASITYSDDLKEIGRSFWCPVRCDTQNFVLRILEKLAEIINCCRPTFLLMTIKMMFSLISAAIHVGLRSVICLIIYKIAFILRGL